MESFSKLVAGVMKWGVWGRNLSPAGMAGLIETAVDLGINTFDHADIYGSYTTEKTFGEALQGLPGLRPRIHLITKCGIRLQSPRRGIKTYDYSRGYIRQSVENSLRALQTDYLDLLLLHRPSPLLDPGEVAEVFHELLSEGKVLAFGASNFTPTQFELLNSRFPLVTNQVQASLLHRDPFFDGVFDQSMRLGLRPMAWSPLGAGKLDQYPAVIQAAHDLGLEPEQALIAFLLHHPARIIPVIGATRPETIRKASQATAITLDPEDWFYLLQSATGQPVP